MTRCREVWLLAKAPFGLDLPDSTIDMYVLLTNAHDGTGAVTACATPVRVAQLTERALAIQRRVGNEQRAALCLLNLGDYARIAGDLELAQARLEEGAAIARSGNWPYIAAATAANLGDLALTRGDRGEACSRYREALIMFVPIGDTDHAAHCLRGLAHHAWVEGRPGDAARLYGAADALAPSSADTDRQSAILHQESAAAIEEQLGPERFRAAYESGARLSLDEAASEAAAGSGRALEVPVRAERP